MGCTQSKTCFQLWEIITIYWLAFEDFYAIFSFRAVWGFYLHQRHWWKRLLLRAVSCLLMINLLFHFRICFTCKCAGKSKLILGKFPQVLCWTSNCIHQHYPLIALCSWVVVGVLFEYLHKHQEGQLMTTILLQRAAFRRGCASWNLCSVQFNVPTAFSDQHSCSRGRIRNQKTSTEELWPLQSPMVTVGLHSKAKNF